MQALGRSRSLAKAVVVFQQKIGPNFCVCSWNPLRLKVQRDFTEPLEFLLNPPVRYWLTSLAPCFHLNSAPTTLVLHHGIRQGPYCPWRGEKKRFWCGRARLLYYRRAHCTMYVSGQDNVPWHLALISVGLIVRLSIINVKRTSILFHLRLSFIRSCIVLLSCMCVKERWSAPLKSITIKVNCWNRRPLYTCKKWKQKWELTSNCWGMTSKATQDSITYPISVTVMFRHYCIIHTLTSVITRIMPFTHRHQIQYMYWLILAIFCLSFLNTISNLRTETTIFAIFGNF